MTNPVSRSRWSDPEVVPLPRSPVEQELAALKRQHQDLQTRHAQLAAALAQLSKQYGATQPLPAAQPSAVSSLAPIPKTESRERTDLSFLSELRQRQAPQPTPMPQVAQPAQLPLNPAAPVSPQSYPVQALQPSQAQQPPAPQWQQEPPKAWQEPQWRQNQPFNPPSQHPTWNSTPSWGQPETNTHAEDSQPQYDSLYERVRHQHDDQSTPMWMWLVAAVVLLTVSFGTGFLMVRHFIGRSAPPPPVESAS